GNAPADPGAPRRRAPSGGAGEHATPGCSNAVPAALLGDGPWRCTSGPSTISPAFARSLLLLLAGRRLGRFGALGLHARRARPGSRHRRWPPGPRRPAAARPVPGTAAAPTPLARRSPRRNGQYGSPW